MFGISGRITKIKPIKLIFEMKIALIKYNI